MNQLQPKFKIGADVWIMENNRPLQCIVSAVEVFLGTIHSSDGTTFSSEDNGKSYTFTYYLKETANTGFLEKELFATKFDLVESLGK